MSPGRGLFEGQVALISGVGPGLGRSLALAYAHEGADLVLAARKQANLDAVRAEVEELGRKVVALPTDITEPGACEALVDSAMGTFGRLDVLVNNAFRQPPLEDLEGVLPDTWRAAFEVNLFGAVTMTDAALVPMREARRGSIIFVASLSARRVRRQFTVYSATKAALLTTMQHYANEFGRDGVRVNAVVPSWIWGPNLEFHFQRIADRRGITADAVYEEVAAEIALGRIPTSEEIATTAMALSSDLNSAVTGAALDVNAGEWFH